MTKDQETWVRTEFGYTEYATIERYWRTDGTCEYYAEVDAWYTHNNRYYKTYKGASNRLTKLGYRKQEEE